MARTWPTLGRQALIPSRLLGGIALAALLGAALAFTPSDGTPYIGVVDPVASSGAFVPEPSVHFEWLRASLGGAPVTVPRPPPPIPTAAPATSLIPSLNVHRPVEPVGVDRAGRMDLPQNAWNAGWYKEGPTPGAPGDAVIEGHAGYPNAPMLFGKLGQLRSGDRIVIVLADGSHQLFLVDSVAVWRGGTGPAGMGEPFGPARLTLITCSGLFDDHYKTYADRMVVETHFAGAS